MADPVISSPARKPLFVMNLSGQNSNPMIPDAFITSHLNGKIQSSKLKLTSDASDRTWEVELDGGRFAGGWKDFSVSHCVRDNDILSFRHDGDMIFHVTPFGRSFSQIQFISSTSDSDSDDDDDDVDDEHKIFDDDDDANENAGVEDVYEIPTSEEDLHPKKISSKKRVRTEAEASSGNSYLIAHVTASSLSRNHLSITYNFARSNGLNERECEIDLMNEDGKSWTLGLNYNKSSGQVYIRGGWRNFCKENEIRAGSFGRFKLDRSGTKPVLQLCPNSSSIPKRNSSKGKGKRIASESDESETEDRSETASMNQNKIVTLELKSYMLRSTELRLPASFTRDNKIEEPGEITIVDKDGVEWKLHLVSHKGRRQFYIRGYRPMFQANGVKKVGDPFTLEAIRGGPSPILKFCPKVKVKQTSVVDGYETPERTPGRKVRASRAEEETETQVQKRARVERGTSRRTRASNKSSVEPENLERKQLLQPCSIFDQVEKVRQSFVDSSTTIIQIQSKLEIMEQSIKNSLLEIDALGEKFMEISRMFNINQV